MKKLEFKTSGWFTDMTMAQLVDTIQHHTTWWIVLGHKGCCERNRAVEIQVSTVVFQP